jgi:hypothetical protein
MIAPFLKPRLIGVPHPQPCPKRLPVRDISYLAINDDGTNLNFLFSVGGFPGVRPFHFARAEEV